MSKNKLPLRSAKSSAPISRAENIEESVNRGLSRMRFVSGCLLLMYILVAARIVDFSLIHGEWKPYVRDDSEAEQTDAPNTIRADILDRNGFLLATSLETASLYADPAMVPDAKETAQNLAAVFKGLDEKDLEEKLSSTRRFVWIKRNLTPTEQNSVLEIGHPGLGFKEEFRRVYPQESMAAHIVGYTDIDGNGLSGIERALDERLRTDPHPVRLSLDIRVQHILREELSRTLETFHAPAGVAAVMDVNSGEILGAVSLPDFDPHHPGESREDQKFNRFSLGLYEMGSTFKTFSTAALLETGNAQLSKTFDARKPLQRGRFRIRDFHAEKRVMTVPEIFVHSSNIGSALMGESIGTEKLQAFYRALGLLDRPDFLLQETSAPLVPNPWREINTLTASYGHGIAVSPLQVLLAASTVVNGGILPHAEIVLNTSDAEKPARKGPEKRVISPQTVHRMRQLLRLTVTDGTGSMANIAGYQVGGKTGTAEKSGAGGYDSSRLISSFLGVFPVDSPRYAILVMADEPKGTHKTHGYATGGWVAAPATGRIIERIGPLLGVPLETDIEREDISLPLRRYLKEYQSSRSQILADNR